MRRAFAAVLGAALASASLGAGAGVAYAGCATAPRAGCKQSVVPGKSSLTFTQTGRTDPDDVYTWKWLFGARTDVADFGSPMSTTGYALCIYDASVRSQPVVANTASAAIGWKSVTGGYTRNYRPNRPLRRLVLKAGADGKARIVAHGDSDTVRQILPFVAPVVVQMQSDEGDCWETTFAAPKRNDDGLFKGVD
jgi:hypothetical protein